MTGESALHAAARADSDGAVGVLAAAHPPLKQPLGQDARIALALIEDFLRVFAFEWTASTAAAEIAGWDQKLPAADVGRVRGVLLDVGISSPQLDGGRGFRPEVDGPLDMRFDAGEGVESAREYLVRASRREFAAALEAIVAAKPD